MKLRRCSQVEWMQLAAFYTQNKHRSIHRQHSTATSVISIILSEHLVQFLSACAHVHFSLSLQVSAELRRQASKLSIFSECQIIIYWGLNGSEASYKYFLPLSLCYFCYLLLLSHFRLPTKFHHSYILIPATYKHEKHHSPHPNIIPKQ
jgi:hypothetical protein